MYIIGSKSNWVNDGRKRNLFISRLKFVYNLFKNVMLLFLNILNVFVFGAFFTMNSCNFFIAPSQN